MAFVRLFIFAFLFLSVIYVLVSIYARSIRRENLEEEWAENNPGDDDSADRAAYIEAGMKAYNSSIRPKLVALVYIVPMIAFFAVIVIVNVY